MIWILLKVEGFASVIKGQLIQKVNRCSFPGLERFISTRLQCSYKYADKAISCILHDSRTYENTGKKIVVEAEPAIVLR
jgi:hypothetical protein